MDKNNQQNWESDFREFLDSEKHAVPKALSAQVLAKIDSKLHPSFWQVLGKLALVQAVAGAISLMFCPQFGISLGGGHGLMHILMKYGDTVCQLGCGFLFMSLSLLVASFALKPEEVRAIREHRWLQLGSLAMLSVVVFACTGGTVALGFGLIWAAGAVIGGITTLELGWSIRRYSYE